MLQAQKCDCSAYGYVYILGFANGVTKIGKTRNLYRRLKYHDKTLGKINSIVKTWTSELHYMYGETEKLLIVFMAQKSEIVDIDVATVIAFAKTLVLPQEADAEFNARKVLEARRVKQACTVLEREIFHSVVQPYQQLPNEQVLPSQRLVSSSELFLILRTAMSNGRIGRSSELSSQELWLKKNFVEGLRILSRYNSSPLTCGPRIMTDSSLTAEAVHALYNLGWVQEDKASLRVGKDFVPFDYHPQNVWILAAWSTETKKKWIIYEGQSYAVSADVNWVAIDADYELCGYRQEPFFNGNWWESATQPRCQVDIAYVPDVTLPAANSKRYVGDQV